MNIYTRSILTLAVIIVVHPILLVLSRFVLGVRRIVHGHGLFGHGRQHAQNANGNGLGRHGGTPVLAQ